MQIEGRVVLVTCGAGGIGRALCQKFATEGARAIVVADVDREAGLQLSREINGFFVPCNPTQEADVQMFVEAAMEQTRHVDIFCSCSDTQAGAGLEASNKQWQGSWESNVMAHVYAARAVLPHMLERKEGYWLQAMAVPGASPVATADSVASYAGLAFASWLAAKYRDQGIRVSAFCAGGLSKTGLKVEFAASNADAITPDTVAADVIRAVKAEKFLTVPKPQKTRQTSAGR
jgi:NAD(P)-dependent dehydrogenase (short-subunit alcohol dehydrogenase family)